MRGEPSGETGVEDYHLAGETKYTGKKAVADVYVQKVHPVFYRILLGKHVANYRQSVLTAFQDVENSLSSLKYLADQSEAENEAFQQYQIALNLTNARYSRGVVSYFDVIEAQGNALNAEQQTVQIAGNRMATTVQLIKALGGGWADSQILRHNHGGNTDAPSAKPTVLGSNDPQTVPFASSSTDHH